MLILTRRIAEQDGSQVRDRKNEIVFTTPSGDQIKLFIFPDSRSQVRVGIDCRREIGVMRGELLEKAA
jgi:sRNA-binding carbon storage regulator CsrA